MKTMVLSASGDKLLVRFPYHGRIVDVMRTSGGRFDRQLGAAWVFPVPTPAAETLLSCAELHGFTVEPAALETLRHSVTLRLPVPAPRGARVLGRSTIELTDNGAAFLIQNAPGPLFAGALKMVKDLPLEQRRWLPDQAVWRVRVSKPAMDVALRLQRMGWTVSAAAAELLQVPSGAAADAVPEYPVYPEPPDDLDGLESLRSASGWELKVFQRRAVARAVTWKGSINAFQVGLGKTIIALATARHAAAFPLVVVCQASKRLDWLEEAAEWLPGRLAVALDGRDDPAPYGADVYVVSYDVLADHANGAPGRARTLAAMRPAMVVLDESQLIKEAGAQRTKAALQLCQAAEYKLLLSGTAVKSRPGELLTQLEAIGGLEAFGGGRGFRARYCNVQEARVGGRTVKKDGPGAKNALELHERLSARWYYRQTKSLVLPELPPVRRHVVPFRIDNREEYERARDEFLQWVYEASLSDEDYAATLPPDLSPAMRDAEMVNWAEEKRRRAQRAAQIAQINALKRVAARGILGGAIRWIDTFLQSGEKLIVFAHHKEMQRALQQAFPGCARLSAADDDAGQHIHKHRFQTDPNCSLIVVSMGVGSTGHTLTAASACAFLELGWTPSDHDQGEGRAYGRMNDPHGLDSYWLVGEQTIYEDILALLDEKRSVVDAILDGLVPEGSDNILGDLMRRLQRASTYVPAGPAPARSRYEPAPGAPAAAPGPALQPALFDLDLAGKLPEPAWGGLEAL